MATKVPITAKGAGKLREELSRLKTGTPPRIRRTRFCGTGTRHLTEAGRRAIAQLFADSFAG